MNTQAGVDQRAHNWTTATHSTTIEPSPRANPPPNPRPQSNFPGVAFCPAPRRPPQSAFKRALSRALHRLKKYLDKKAAKYAEQQLRRPTRASRTRARRWTDEGSRQHTTSINGNRNYTTRVTPPRTQQQSRLSSGALPLLRQNASTTSLDAKGPFSATQKMILSRKLTTIRESSAEVQPDGAASPSFRSLSTFPYSEVDAASDSLNHGPTTPILEPAELGEHFPNLTCKQCSVDWAHADWRAMNDLTLLRNTEAMRAVSRDAAAILRAEGGWIQCREAFDDSAWRDNSIRHALTTVVNVRRWYRHHRTTSGQSVPSLSSSHSSQGSAVESFPTPANATQHLYDDHSIEHRLNSPPSRTKDSPTNTPVITVSEWDEDGNSYNDELNSHPGASRVTSTNAPVADDQPQSTAYLRPPKTLARLRGKQPWYLQEFSPPFNPAPLPLVEPLSVPTQPVDFFMETPLMIPASGQSPTRA